MKQLGIYIHIPFCVKKCVYCDFLSAPADSATKKTYMEALQEEIKATASQYQEYVVQTVFFGGGTPSCVDRILIADCLKTVKECFCVAADAEISMEFNSGTIGSDDEKTFECLLRAGINRLSIGLQSAQNKELKMLGRIHTYEDFLNTYALAKRAGFQNINIDLISALPGQCLETWRETLKAVIACNPSHISVYSLIVEENTYLFDHIGQYPPLPDEDTDRMMYHETNSILAEHGYHRYEISNYAKKGFDSRHNQIYWQRGCDHISDYIGFGLGASSTVGNYRYRNADNLAEYLKNAKTPKQLRCDEEFLSQTDLMEEFCFLGLRRMEGISASEFERTFGTSLDSIYQVVLNKWKDANCLCEKDGFWRLTEKGIDISNRIFADFLDPPVL